MKSKESVGELSLIATLQNVAKKSLFTVVPKLELRTCNSYTPKNRNLKV